MNKSKYVKDNHIQKIIDECRLGNFDNLPKIYNAYIYILNGYINTYKTKDEEIKKVQDYFYDSIKLFARYGRGYNIVSYIYSRLENYNKKDIIIEKEKESDIEDISNNTEKEKENDIEDPKIMEYYKKYYYLIKKYVKSYDYYQKHEAILFSQELLKKAISEMLGDNIDINEIRINKYFANFDYNFKRGLGNIEIILEDIKSGEANYINLVFEKYEPNIRDILDEINGNEYDRKICISYINRIVDNYNKGILNPESSINHYIINGLNDIKRELKYNRSNISPLIYLIKTGRTEYIYSILSLFKSNIDEAVNNTVYDKNSIKKYCEKLIIDCICEYIDNIDRFDIKNFKRKVYNKLRNIDRKYYLNINKIPDIKVKELISKIRKGKYELVSDLVEYYKSKLKLEFNYSNAEKDLIGDLLFKLLIVDINKYLFNENYEFSFALDKYIEIRANKYKDILDNYIKSLEDSMVSTEDALMLSKKENNFIYVIYKRYEKNIDSILKKNLKIKLNEKYNGMKKNILYNSVKNYILSNDNLTLKDLEKNIYVDFLWLNDINESNEILRNEKKWL